MSETLIVNYPDDKEIKKLMQVNLTASWAKTRLQELIDLLRDTQTRRDLQAIKDGILTLQELKDDSTSDNN